MAQRPLLARGSQGELGTHVVRKSHLGSRDPEHPSLPWPSRAGDTPAPAWHRGPHHVSESQLQLRLGQLELLFSDSIGQHLPVRVVGVGLRSQFEEFPDRHAQGPVEMYGYQRAVHMFSKPWMPRAAPIITPVTRSSAFLQ